MRSTRRPITVMQLEHDPAQNSVVLNPYLKLLTDALPEDRIRTRWFRWKGVFVDSFDVLHVHWPEFYLRHRTLIGRAIKTLLFTVFLARIAITRRTVVRTIHNLKPHEDGSWFERFLLARLERLTSLWIVMNETTPTTDPGRTVLIPHGHYRGWHSPPREVRPQTGRLVTFGRLRAYKGVGELISAFHELSTPTPLTLHVLGKPDSANAGESIRRIANGDTRIRFDLRFIPDDELAAEILDCEFVVLPYRDILNSGSALLALSLNRPVILRNTDSTKLLAEEFGDEWVSLFSGDLTPDKLLTSVDGLRRSPRAEEVDMSNRDWPTLAVELADAYVRAISIRDR